MALAEYYVDPTTASNGGDGSSGTPWTRADQAVVQYALDNIASETGGVRINVKTGSGCADVGLDLATYVGSNTLGDAAPLIIQGYTTTAGDGGIAEFDLGGGTTGLTDTGADWDYVTLRHLEVHNVGAVIAIQVDAQCQVIQCRVHNAASHGIRVGGLANRIIGNYVHDCGGNAIFLVNSTSAFVFRNVVIDDQVNNTLGNYGIRSQASNAVIIENIVYIANTSSMGISDANSGNFIAGNSVFSDVANTTAGIQLQSSAEQSMVLNNLIEGFSGTGGVGIQWLGGECGVTGGNAVYNCTTAYDYGTNVIAKLGDDETLSASPFAGTNFGTPASVVPSDFIPQDTGNVKYGAVPRVAVTFE